MKPFPRKPKKRSGEGEDADGGAPLRGPREADGVVLRERSGETSTSATSTRASSTSKAQQPVSPQHANHGLPVQPQSQPAGTTGSNSSGSNRSRSEQQEQDVAARSLRLSLAGIALPGAVVNTILEEDEQEVFDQHQVGGRASSRGPGRTSSRDELLQLEAQQEIIADNDSTRPEPPEDHGEEVASSYNSATHGTSGFSPVADTAAATMTFETLHGELHNVEVFDHFKNIPPNGRGPRPPSSPILVSESRSNSRELLVGPRHVSFNPEGPTTTVVPVAAEDEERQRLREGLGQGTTAGGRVCSSDRSSGWTPVGALVGGSSTPETNTNKKMTWRQPNVDLVQPPHPLVWWVCQPCCVYREHGCEEPFTLGMACFCWFLPVTEPEKMVLRNDSLKMRGSSSSPGERDRERLYHGPYRWAWNEKSCFCPCLYPWELRFDRDKAQEIKRLRAQEENMRPSFEDRQKNSIHREAELRMKNMKAAPAGGPPQQVMA
ncbi:unnamed protein product [Amoebophrya sp. A120]|nr:unnamed protein product [Amoebophrya sp. A120]|eukprot:GSA120T00017691001.1